MHIALIAPLVSPIHDDVTPLGGAQAVVADLAHGLLDRGHRVSLIAADGSFVRGAETPCLGIDAAHLAPADFTRPGPRTDSAQQSAAFQRVRSWLETHAAEVDIVHGHAFDAPSFFTLQGLPMTVVHTLHLPPLDAEVTEAARAVQPPAAFVSVSRASEAQWRASGIPIQRCIYPGVRLDDIPFRQEPGSYLLFAGRITPEKGPDQAIDIAKSLGRALVLAGEIYDRDYFEGIIAPRVRTDRGVSRTSLPTSGVTYIGPRSRSDLHELMSHARAVLMPSTWDEPFGLVGIEAQATGTPVVAYRRGGLAEVVAHGETGWLITPGDRVEFVKRVSMIEIIDRRRCRERVERQFSMRGMVDSYLELYQWLAGRTP